jgi:hypothetical protein
VRGSQATSAATRRRGQRNWHRLVPASSGAKASLACEDRAARSGVPARRLSVAEVGERRLGSEKHDPLAIGACGREPEPLSRTTERWSSFGGFKSVDDRRRGGQAAKPGETRAGRSRERRGAEVFARWKALPIAFGACSFTREGKGAISAALDVSVNVRTITAPRERRQGCQRLGTYASRWEDNARRDEKPLPGRARATRQSENCADVHQAITSISVCR